MRTGSVDGPKLPKQKTSLTHEKKNANVTTAQTNRDREKKNIKYGSK